MIDNIHFGIFQPFRNSTFGIAEAKTIHGDWHGGQKHVMSSGDMDKKVKSFSMNVVLKLINYSFPFQPFRNSPIILPEAKTIYGVGDVGQKYVTPSEVVDEKVGNMM